MAFRIIPFKKNNPDSLRLMYSIELKKYGKYCNYPATFQNAYGIVWFERNAPNQIKRP